AKSAVCSGIITLVRAAGIELEDIDRLYVSGGFSAKINVSKAVETGLLPMELEHRAEMLNNSSLLGAVDLACDGAALSEITGRAEYLDLSQSQTFTTLFVENMMF
ncbi:MAG: DUF4445 domain-containing protein, partial [Clostridia bacterium]|nr:DUF4445 domain-containing protein [Clostridia bacterium]